MAGGLLILDEATPTSVPKESANGQERRLLEKGLETPLNAKGMAEAVSPTGVPAEGGARQGVYAGFFGATHNPLCQAPFTGLLNGSPLTAIRQEPLERG
jgi:hypothetical protein